MTKVQWNTSGDRFYEAGVDRGVLYPVGKPGVPWNGLISVKESASGGEPRAYYVDGVKYLNVADDEEFIGSIEAYTYPKDFSPLDGNVITDYGLIAGQQGRGSFNLCYRTQIGNDTDGAKHGYRLHLIYNVLTAPSDKGYNTLSDTVDPVTFNWSFTTTPVFLSEGLRPTAHVILDTRYIDSWVMSIVESRLYGTATSDPQFFSVAELIDLVMNQSSIRVVDNLDGSWTVLGFDANVRMTSDTEFEITSPSAVMLNDTTYTLSSPD